MCHIDKHSRNGPFKIDVEKSISSVVLMAGIGALRFDIF